MSAELTINFTKTDSSCEEETLCELIGAITRNCDLHTLDELEEDHVIVDFAMVKSIDSYGIMKCIQMLQNRDMNIDITYKNCPKIFVELFNLLPDLLGKNVFIHSIEAPHHCGKCNHSFNEMVNMGAYVSKGLESPDCPKCGHVHTKLDADEEHYFNFIWEVIKS